MQSPLRMALPLILGLAFSGVTRADEVHHDARVSLDVWAGGWQGERFAVPVFPVALGCLSSVRVEATLDYGSRLRVENLLPFEIPYSYSIDEGAVLMHSDGTPLMEWQYHAENPLQFLPAFDGEMDFAGESGFTKAYQGTFPKDGEFAPDPIWTTGNAEGEVELNLLAFSSFWASHTANVATRLRGLMAFEISVIYVYEPALAMDLDSNPAALRQQELDLGPGIAEHRAFLA